MGASVTEKNTFIGTVTNNYGFFSLTIPISSEIVQISYIGYTIFELKDFKKNKVPIEIQLVNSTDLEEVTISGQSQLDKPIGSISIPMKQIKAIPALLGEVDILKALSLTPGVSAGTEGSAGINVRGGSPDQNLILLDEAPVYNVTHLGGFFSVFNSNSLKTVDMYKGAFPARYGGRLASVIDIITKDGDNQKFGGQVGLGLLNQNLTMEGPIIKDKASFIVSGRISTLGLTKLIKSKRPINATGEQFQYDFYDLNAKINYEISKKDKLFISFYNGYDHLTYSEWSKTENTPSETKIGNNWGNSTLTIRYTKLLSNKLFVRTTLLFSKYNSQFTNHFFDQDPISKEPRMFFRIINAGIQDLGSKFQLDYFPNAKLSIKTGIDLTQHVFTPFIVNTNYSVLSKYSKQIKVQANQIDCFLESDWRPIKKLSVNGGLRLSSYFLADKKYANIEPRIGINWEVLGSWTIKGGYSVMNQYLHLLVNNGYGLGYDSWLPSTVTIPQSKAKQHSIGFTKEFPLWGLKLSTEIYIKNTANIIDYREGTNFTGALAAPWETLISKNGKGRSKGLEIMIDKNGKKLNGWVSYTLSKSESQFSDINLGQWFPTKYDRRHNFSLTGSLELSKKWRLGSTFIFQTGNPITMPVAGIYPDNVTEPQFVYTLRNNIRMPAYHRLDIGATRSLITKNNRKAALNIGFFNVYNRKNPLYLDIKKTHDPVTHQLNGFSVKQYSLFPILPYITYTLNF